MTARPCANPECRQPLLRKPHESASNFQKRKSCSPACAAVLMTVWNKGWSDPCTELPDYSKLPHPFESYTEAEIRRHNPMDDAPFRPVMATVVPLPGGMRQQRPAFRHRVGE